MFLFHFVLVLVLLITSSQQTFKVSEHMSTKKKQFSSCDKCGCHILPKDAARHGEFCGKPLEDWQISLVRPRVGMKGYVCTIDKFGEYLPPDALGWTRANSVLINPQTLDLLGASPRQPVRLSVNNSIIIGILWPCKEVPAMKIAITSGAGNPTSLCMVEIIWEKKVLNAVAVSIKSDVDTNNVAFQEFLQMYLSYSYVEPGVSFPVSYYGNVVDVTVEEPISLEESMHNMSLNEGEVGSDVFQLSSPCTISVVGLSSRSQSQKQEISKGLDEIPGMDSIRKMLNEYVLYPFLRDHKACSIIMWGLPGSGKTLVLTKLAQCLKEASFYSPALAVILSIRQVDDVDVGIRVRFPIEVELSVPTEFERLSILKHLLKTDDEKLQPLARRTHGFTGGDLNSLVTASQFATGSTLIERLESSLRFIRPTGIRQFVLEVPDVKWDDIGGNEELKEEIQQAVIWPQKHREVFDRFGIDAPSGILLYGPPGCSKTLIARALANESKMNFLAVKGPELFSKWVGESERAIRELFSRARQVAPTIIFFDEIDAVGASRGSEKSSGVSDRVLAQLLTELDGLEKASGVILLAATNRPDQLDSALLRPGRLDRSIHVGLPTPSTRRAILGIRLKKMQLAQEVSVETLVDKTEGYSGAELVALCRTAALIAMREDMSVSVVQWKHFEKALIAVVPRTEQYLLEIYHNFQLGCISN